MVPKEWPLRILAVASLVGIAVSLYLTVAHYSSAPLACVQNAVANCDLVTRSSFGVLPGTDVPVSAAGIAWFAANLVLSLFPARMALLHALWSLAGLAVVLYLVFAEVRLGHLCEWCTLVHLLVILTVLITVARLTPRPASQAP